MKRKTSRILAVVAALAFTSLAMAQDGGATTLFGFELPDFGFSLTNLASAIGPIAGIIWFILFAAWGGFRWLY